jgi:pyruvate-ferredoxin/flavodoxin oxidoreductase
MSHQKDAVRSGYWPLYRFQPSEIEDGQPFKLDSHAPSIPVRDFVSTETRYAILARTHPERAEALAALMQSDADERWRYYAGRYAPDGPPHPDPVAVPAAGGRRGGRERERGRRGGRGGRRGRGGGRPAP